MSKQSLYFFLKNNTNGTIPVSLLNPSLPDKNVANQRTNYKWDISSVVYSPLTFSILAKFNATDSFQAFGGELAAANANALVAALNSLNIGAFWLEISGLTTFLVTYNDKVFYDNLTVGAASPTVITISWFNNTQLPGGSLKIDKNAVNVVNSPNAVINNGAFLANNGDTIDINVEASVGEITGFNVYEVLVLPPNTYTPIYSNNVSSGGSDDFSFPVNILNNYEIVWGNT